MVLSVNVVRTHIAQPPSTHGTDQRKQTPSPPSDPGQTSAKQTPSPPVRPGTDQRKQTPRPQSDPGQSSAKDQARQSDHGTDHGTDQRSQTTGLTSADRHQSLRPRSDSEPKEKPRRRKSPKQQPHPPAQPTRPNEKQTSPQTKKKPGVGVSRWLSDDVRGPTRAYRSTFRPGPPKRRSCPLSKTKSPKAPLGRQPTADANTDNEDASTQRPQSTARPG